MNLPQPIHEGLFKRRYKRFFADIEFKSQIITAHVPNTGSLKSCLFEDSPCYFSESDDPERKLKFTLQSLKTPTSWVGVNTQNANSLAWELWLSQKLPAWQKFQFARREVKISKHTRFDIALWNQPDDIDPKKPIPLSLFKTHPFHFVEVKNVTLAEGETALFPDAITERGQKHLRELIHLVDQGHSCEMVFVIQRTDCKTFSPARSIDPKYSVLLETANKKGVKISPYACTITKSKIEIDLKKSIKLIL